MEHITIDLDYYDQLVTNMENYNTFINHLLNTAKLGYDKESLRFSDSDINTLLNILNNWKYKNRIKALKEEEKDNATTNE